MTAPGAPPATSRGRNAAVTAVGQAFVLLGATAIGLIVAARLGASVRVDAYFAANQVFAAALFAGQGIRTSIPSLEGGGLLSRSVAVRSVAWIAAVATLALIAVAFLGPLVLPDDVGADFTRDLLVLAPGAAFQIAGGYLAARLAIAQRFTGASLAYAAATLCNAALLLLRIDEQGAEVLAPAALAGSVVAGLLLLVLAVRSGALGGSERPEPTHSIGTAGAVGRILLGLAPVLAAQAAMTIVILAAASARPGGSALLAYAFLATNALSTLAVAPISIVLSSDLGQTWDRSVETLLSLARSVAALATAVLAPVAVAVLLLGPPIADWLLPGLSSADVSTILEVFALQVPSLPLSAAAMVGLVAAITIDRLPALAWRLAALVVPFTLAVVVIVRAGGDLVMLGVATLVWAVAVAVATLSVSTGAATGRCVAAILARSLELLLPSAVIAAAVARTAPDLALVPALLIALAAALIHVGWLALRAPAELRALRAVVRPG